MIPGEPPGEDGARIRGELRKILNHAGLAEHHVLDKNFYASMSMPIAGVAHRARSGP